MKKLTITIAIIGMTMVSYGSALSFWTSDYKELVQPIEQEKESPLPEFINKKNENTKHIDITPLIKPEVEEELPPFIKRLKKADLS